MGNSNGQAEKVANRSSKVGLYHYLIAAYAVLKRLFLPRYRETSGLKPVMLFFSAHIGDAVIFLDVLREYQKLYCSEKGYHLVLACRKEVWAFLDQLGCTGDMEFIEVNRDEILRSFSKFRKAVQGASRYRYAIFINPRVVSVIEYVFEYCLCAKEKHVVRVEGDQSKGSFQERFFRDGLDHDVTYVPRDKMVLGRFYTLLDKLSGTKHPVRLPRLDVPESALEVPTEYCVFAPSTAETPSKCWPADRYARLIDEVVEKYDLDICFSGGKADRVICQRVLEMVQHKNRIHDYVGNTSFLEWVNLIRGARLVVCNDSSPMHIAAATGRPCVCIGGQWEGDCYYPYVVEELRDDDVIPQVVLGQKLPCYYCTLTTHGRLGNPECKEAIDQAEAYPCVRCVEYEPVWQMLTEQLG